MWASFSYLRYTFMAFDTSGLLFFLYIPLIVPRI